MPMLPQKKRYAGLLKDDGYLGKIMNRDNEQKKTDGSKMLHIISRGDRLLFIAVMLMLGALAVWMFKGTIKETVPAKGVISCTNTALKISSPVDGTISEMNNSMSDYVSKGDLIARVSKDDDGEGQSGGNGVRTIDITSDVSGFVTEVSGYEGDSVSKAAPLLTIIKANPQDLDEVIALVDNEALNLIHKGTRAEVRVNGFSDEMFGYIAGEVIDADLRLINKRRLSHIIGNEMVADTLLETRGAFAVTVRLDKDDEGNYIFSKRKADASNLKINSPCDVTFIVDEISPYKVFLGEK